MPKYNKEFELKVVKYYLENNISTQKIARYFKISDIYLLNYELGNIELKDWKKVISFSKLMQKFKFTLLLKLAHLKSK